MPCIQCHKYKYKDTRYLLRMKYLVSFFDYIRDMLVGMNGISYLKVYLLIIRQPELMVLAIINLAGEIFIIHCLF